MDLKDCVFVCSLFNSHSLLLSLLAGCGLFFLIFSPSSLLLVNLTDNWLRTFAPLPGGAGGGLKPKECWGIVWKQAFSIVLQGPPSKGVSGD